MTERNPADLDGDVLDRHDNISPEDALADVREQLAASQAAAERERVARLAAEQQAQQAAGATAGAHEAALAARLAAEDQKIGTAKAALRAARESGDLDAETDAMQHLASATQMKAAFQAEQARIRSQPAARHQAQPQQQGGQSEAAQRWISEHPRFNTDRYYRATAEAAHFEAVESGIQTDTPAYFAHINRVIAEKYGQEGRQDVPDTRQTPPRQRAPASSYGTPPARGANGPARDGTDINRIAAEISALGDGQVTPEAIRHHADIAGMKLEDYLKSQAQILAERRGRGFANAGGNLVFK